MTTAHLPARDGVPAPTRAVLLLAALAGASDASTGVVLMLAPRLALSALGLPVPADTIFLRWIGVFVFVVGLAYAYPFLWREPHARAARLCAAFELTAVARLAVAGFVAVAVGAGALEFGWLGVGAFDAALALAQIALLARGAVGDVD